MGERIQRSLLALTVGAGIFGGGMGDSLGFTFVFAGEANGVDRVTHPAGYVGTGGVLNVSVGIDQTSLFATDMVQSTMNVISTINGLTPTTGNLKSGLIGGGEFDFESVLLHEMCHALGLGHVNLASESGLGEPTQNHTKSTNGVDNVFNVDAGVDGIIGSADDVRGDDVNLNYFLTASNNPFALGLPATIDSTTYSRDIADLPVGDLFSANADRTVGAALGFANTEAVMQQGTFAGEVQRTLGADDVAGLRYGMSGLDELQGTSDDYTINLVYAGLTTSADILIDFDNGFTSFASAYNSAIFVGDHAAMTSSSIYFSTSVDWAFSEMMLIPEPGRAVLGLAGLFVVVLRRRR